MKGPQDLAGSDFKDFKSVPVPRVMLGPAADHLAESQVKPTTDDIY
jgi:hypothetical protein